jgi:hypothetical protein
MSEEFDAVGELKEHGLLDDSVTTEAERILSTLTPTQVEACIEVKRRVDALEDPAVQDQPVEDGSLALAMASAMGWDRPSSALVDAEVEGMSVSATEASCACLCTGSGGGGGASAA